MKRTHVLYTGKCNKGDKGLSWNKTGPRGPQGQQGPQGLPGSQGPSDAFSTGFRNSAKINTSGLVTVASLSVPGGKFYAVTSTLSILNSTGHEKSRSVSRSRRSTVVLGPSR